MEPTQIPREYQAAIARYLQHKTEASDLQRGGWRAMQELPGSFWEDQPEWAQLIQFRPHVAPVGLFAWLEPMAFAGVIVESVRRRRQIAGSRRKIIVLLTLVLVAAILTVLQLFFSVKVGWWLELLFSAAGLGYAMHLLYAQARGRFL